MDPTCDAASDCVEIRVRNGSDEDFERVRVQFPDQDEEDYGPVPAGRATSYRAIAHAYRYAGVAVETGDGDLLLQPIDYMGEAELPPGRYTYALDVENGQLSMQLETEP